MNKTILLVEDDHKDEMLILRALEKDRIANDITVVRDGAEAVEYLLSGKNELPTLVLLDLKLPKLNGTEVLIQIRGDKRTNLLPVVIFTSSDEERDILDSYASGANGYVCKPVQFEEFSRAIQEVGLYWLVTNKEPPGERC